MTASAAASYVLIADSQPKVAAQLVALVKELRPALRVERLEEGQAVLDRLAEGLPELVIAEGELPGYGGLELLRYLRSTHGGAALPFILTSARVDAASVRAVVPLNPSAYMARPLDRAKLRKRLDILLPVPPSTLDAAAAPPDLNGFLEAQRVLAEGSPLLGDVSQAIGAFLRARERDIGELAREMASDPQVTARLIAAGNGAAQHRGMSCQTVTQALQRLGLARALNLVLGLSLERCARLSDERLGAHAQQQWRKAQRCAELAEWLARRLGLDADLCQTAGLLHNIGELALLRCLQHWREQQGELDEETIIRAVGQRSAGFGSSLRIRWRLPLGLREPIAAFYGMSSGVHGREALVLALTGELLALPADVAPVTLLEGRTARLLKVSPLLLESLPAHLLGRDAAA